MQLSGQFAQSVSILARRAFIGFHGSLELRVIWGKENPLVGFDNEDFVPSLDMQTVSHVLGECCANGTAHLSERDFSNHDALGF